MVGIEEQISEIEEEIKKTPYNKKTQHHIGKLKAKLARLREEQRIRHIQTSSRGKATFAIKKSGHATVCLVGFPSVGKSTILTKITNADSKIGEYAYTTLNVVPGTLEYQHAKIQILDLPGIIEGAAKGRGRGREVLSSVRSASLILLIADVFNYNIRLLIEELHSAGIILNRTRPDITVTKKARGGLTINATVRLTKLNLELIQTIIREYGIINADVVIREDVDENELIDALSDNVVYIPAVICLNKIDLLNHNQIVTKIQQEFPSYRIVPISAEKNVNLEELKKVIYEELHLIRVYLKPQGAEADLKEPLVIKSDSTVKDICEFLHRDFVEKFRYAQIWGKNAKYPGQTVGLDYKLSDGDILTIIIRKGG